jgi:hypothetical protein
MVHLHRSSVRVAHGHAPLALAAAGALCPGSPGGQPARTGLKNSGEARAAPPPLSRRRRPFSS